MTVPLRPLRLFLIFFCLGSNGTFLLSQTSSAAHAAPETQDPLQRPAPKNRDAYRKELQQYKTWLKDTPVSVIITDEERSAFLKLSNNAERDNFIEQFWAHRDPTPETAENEYREEDD